MDQGAIGIALITIGVNLFGWFFLAAGPICAGEGIAKPPRDGSSSRA